jgi:hypothetical protein
MKIMLALVTAAGLVGGGALAVHATRDAQSFVLASVDDSAMAPPRRIIIGLDISRSNPLVDDPAFAAKVGERIANTVRALGFASEVHVRTFGSYDSPSNNFAYDALISTRNRPDHAGDEVYKLISGTPQLVANGRWKSQTRTNILAFLDNVSLSIGCTGLPTTVILASDGLEDSEYVRLQKPGARLPTPSGAPFHGCVELEILGLGQGTHSPIQTSRLRAEWARWAQAAGFASFVGLNDW